MSDLQLDEAPLKLSPGDALSHAPNRRPGTGVPEFADQTRVQPPRQAAATISNVRLGTLIAFADDGRTPLVVYAGQAGSAAIVARATVDLHGAHIGRTVVLLFEYGDPSLPIVMGCLNRQDGDPTVEAGGCVEVDADGQRLLIAAKEQLVLRCGKAVITLTKAGKVLIKGTYISSRSSGSNRIRGGSVQIN